MNYNAQKAHEAWMQYAKGVENARAAQLAEAERQALAKQEAQRQAEAMARPTGLAATPAGQEMMKDPRFASAFVKAKNDYDSTYGRDPNKTYFTSEQQRQNYIINNALEKLAGDYARERDILQRRADIEYADKYNEQFRTNPPQKGTVTRFGPNGEPIKKEYEFGGDIYKQKEQERQDEIKRQLDIAGAKNQATVDAAKVKALADFANKLHERGVPAEEISKVWDTITGAAKKEIKQPQDLFDTSPAPLSSGSKNLNTSENALSKTAPNTPSNSASFQSLNQMQPSHTSGTPFQTYSPPKVVAPDKNNSILAPDQEAVQKQEAQRKAWDDLINWFGRPNPQSLSDTEQYFEGPGFLESVGNIWENRPKWPKKKRTTNLLDKTNNPLFQYPLH